MFLWLQSARSLLILAAWSISNWRKTYRNNFFNIHQLIASRFAFEEIILWSGHYEAAGLIVLIACHYLVFSTARFSHYLCYSCNRHVIIGGMLHCPQSLSWSGVSLSRASVVKSLKVPLKDGWLLEEHIQPSTNPIRLYHDRPYRLQEIFISPEENEKILNFITCLFAVVFNVFGTRRRFERKKFLLALLLLMSIRGKVLWRCMWNYLRFQDFYDANLNAEEDFFQIGNRT